MKGMVILGCALIIVAAIVLLEDEIKPAVGIYEINTMGELQAHLGHYEMNWGTPEAQELRFKLLDATTREEEIKLWVEYVSKDTGISINPDIWSWR